jgi:hypothetical protein
MMWRRIRKVLNSGRDTCKYSAIVWGAISYNWKSPLIFLDGTGKRGVQVSDYLDQVLGPMVAPAFRGFWGMRVIGQNKMKMKNGVYMLRTMRQFMGRKRRWWKQRGSSKFRYTSGRLLRQT